MNTLSINNTTGDWTGGLSNSTDIKELSAFRLVLAQRINRFVCCVLGFPLNILVMVVIARSRQLWAPRNVFWLAVTFFNFIAVVESTIELDIYYLYQRSDGSHQLLCEIFSTQLGCPYGLLLAGLTLASFDRYLTLARHQFYQKYGTTRNAVFVLIFTFLLVTGVGMSPYWTGIFTIECGIRYKWLASTLCIHGILSSTCLAVQARLFFFIRSCLRYAPAVENIHLQQIYPHQTSACSLKGEVFDMVEGRERSKRNNRLEIRAARILGLGILPFCLVNLTLCICGVARAFLESDGSETFWLRLVMKTCRELIRLHLIYIPIVFMSQSREFHAAAKRFHRSKKSTSVGEFN